MEHRPIVHTERQVGGASAPGVEFHVDPRENAARIETAAPVHTEVVTLSGHRHVVVAVEANLGGAAGHVCGEGGKTRPLRRLRFLAPERPAHPPALAHHCRAGHAEHAGDEVLYLRRMLRRGVDPHLLVLAGDRERRLPFEIEMLLPADAHTAFEPVRGCCNRGPRLPAPEFVRRQDLGAGDQPFIHGDTGSDRLDVDAGAPRCTPGRVASLGDHREDHLSVKEDLARRENRIVAKRGAAIVRAGNVRCGQHRQHPGAGTHRVQVQRADGAARRAGTSGCDVHRARGFAEIVDVGGGPLDVPRGAVVSEGEADARALTDITPVRERGVRNRHVRLHRQNTNLRVSRRIAPSREAPREDDGSSARFASSRGSGTGTTITSRRRRAYLD